MRIVVTAATTIQIPASAGSGQVCIGIGGYWRYRTTAVSATVTGTAGGRDIFVTAQTNIFSDSPAPDTDTTVYDFGLETLTTGSTPVTAGVVAYRKIGELDWDGSTITAVRQIVGYTDATLPITPTAQRPVNPPLRAIGATGHTANLIEARVGPSGANLFAVSAAGAVNGPSYSVNGTLLAASHLSNGTIGTGAVVLAVSPTLTGTPLSPTAAADTNTTQVATTAYVVGQAGSASPLMDGAATVGTSLRYARQDHVHPIDTSRAPLAAPTFTGVPAAPTAAVDTNTTQLATTAFVLAQAASASPLMDGSVAVGTSTRYARADHVHPTDTSRAPLASPTFTGTPAAPTPAGGTNTTQIATTAFVTAAVAGATNNGAITTAANNFTATQTFSAADGAQAIVVKDTTASSTQTPYLVFTDNAGSPASVLMRKNGTSFEVSDGTNTNATITTAGVVNARTGLSIAGTPISASSLSNGTTGTGSVVLAAGAALTGVPTAPTAAASTNTTQIATTAFVLANGTALSSSTPVMDGTGAAGSATTAARGDHVHPTDTSRAPLASPSFTGTPTSSTYALNAGALTARQGGSATSQWLQARVAADTIDRLTIDVAGTHNWGPGGGAALDTTLGRTGTSTLTLTGSLAISSTLTVGTKPTGYGSGSQVVAGTKGALSASSTLNDVITNLSSLVADLRTMGLIGA